MATNIEITAQLNKLLSEQNQMYLAQAKIQKGQLAIMQAMAEAMGSVDVSKMNDSMSALTDQINAADEALNKMNDTGQKAGTQAAAQMSEAKLRTLELAEAAEKAAEKTERLAIASAAMEGATKGFQLTFNILGSIVGILGTAARGVGQFAMAVLRFPIGIWNFLFEKATSGGGGGELRQTLENIRKEFGDLNKNASAAIIGMAKSMKGTLAETGISVYKTFGNLAERLKYVAELAKALGPIFTDVFQRGLIKSIEAVGAFQKGLGLSNEQMKTIARQSVISGQTMDESLRQTANQAIQLGEAFGMNAMEISRDMAEMEGDMKHFGGMSKAEFGAAAVYVKKLGLEIKSLTGIVDAFDNLDTAATNVARLNQQLGIQLETLELMRLEGPARLEYVRKQFEKTGQTFEQLDRRTQQYFATTIGLTQEEAALAFAQNNRGVGLDQIKKKSEEAEKKQLTQAEAMKKLADSIERLVKSGGGGAKTLFGAFAEGFEQAIFRSREFRLIMREIRQILRITRQAGRAVGRAFIEMFPGVKTILGGLADLFNPTRWRNTMNKVVEVFKSFFRDLQTNPEAGLKNLFDRLKRVFFDHFDASTGAGRKLIDGFKTFFSTIFKAIVGGLKVFVPLAFGTLTDVIKGINNILKGGALSIETDGIKGQIIGVLTELWQAIKPSGEILWGAIKELLGTVWTKIKGWIGEHSTELALFFFGPAFIRALIGAGIAAITTSVTKAVTSGAVTGTISKAAAAVRRSGAAAAAAGAGGGGGGTAGGAIFTLQEMQGVIEETRTAATRSRGVDTTALKELGAKLLIIAGVLAVAGVAMAISMRMMVAILKGVSLEEITIASIVIGAMVVGMAGIAGASKLLANVNTGDVMKALPAAVAVGALGVVMAATMGLIIGGFQAVGITAEGATTAAIAMGAAAIIFTAAIGLAYAGAGLAAIVASTAGIGAGAIVAGVVFIGTIAAGMAAGVIGIIKAVNSIDTGGDTAAFTSKIDAFTGIFSSVVDFSKELGIIMSAGAAASFAELISMLNPVNAISAFFGLFTGQRAETPFNSMIKLVESISGGVINIIQEVSRVTANLTAEQINGLVAIAPIINAIAELATTIRIPDNFASGFFTDDAANLELMRTWFTQIGSVLTGPNGLIQKASQIIRDIAGIPVVNTEAVKASGEILKSIVGLTSAIKMDPEYIKLLQETSDRDNFGSISAFALNNVSRNADGVVRIIDAVKDKIPSILDSITSIARKYTPAELKRAAQGATVVGSAIEMVVSLLNAVKSIGTTKAGIGVGEGKAQITDIFDRGTFDSIKGLMEGLVDTVFKNEGLFKKIVDGINRSGVGGLQKGIGEKVGAIGQVITAIAQLGSQEVQDAFKNIGLIGISGGVNIDTDALGRLLGGMSAALGNVTFSKSQANQTKNFTEAINNIIPMFNSLQGLLSTAADPTTGLSTIRNALFGSDNNGGIIGTANDIVNQLNNLDPININAGLERLAGSLALGASDSFTIDHRNFQIQVNFTVNLNAQKIEEAIVSNPAGTLVLTRTEGPVGRGRLRGRG